MAKHSPLLAGLEAGGTSINCVVTRGTGSILARARFPTEKPQRTLEKVLDFFREESARLGP